jgi:hypothetical protein
MATSVGRATQEFVPIKEVRDGYAILKDGSMRAILMCSSVNFALKSSDEQQAILFQFQNLLNSIDFSVQIFIQSRKLDIRPYLALLEQRQKEQMNDLLRIQIQEYIGFVKNFTETTNIMSKNFFMVIPYAPAALNSKNPLKMFKKEAPKETQVKEDELFEEHRAQIEERVSVVQQGLTRCGVRVAQLGTEEITELFYKIFNPGETEKPIKLT